MREAMARMNRKAGEGSALHTDKTRDEERLRGLGSANQQTFVKG